jgi:uncharacterized protein YgbK (DUF1537 family)
LADDLTGALDTSAEMVGFCGPAVVGWSDKLPAKVPPCLAVDTGTRELPRAEALRIVGGLAPLLSGAGIAYKKIDSLLRGSWAAELSACFRLGTWRHCVVAPAFPYQGRSTRAGRQLARSMDGSWAAVNGDLVAELRGHGLAVARAKPGDRLAEGVSVFDAETDEDLDRIVAVGRAAGDPVLWCGSGGLASALARDHQLEASSRLRAPVLGLFGSDQPVNGAQLAACREHWIVLSSGYDDAPAIERRLATDGVALLSVDLSAGMSRAAAARTIAETLANVALALAPPGTLIVAGGETLKSLCASLGTESLLVTGRVAPGLPRSIMRGGHWNGVEIVSKSGAFGPPSLWRDLLTENGVLPERIEP